MQDGLQRDQWQHTATILAHLSNLAARKNVTTPAALYPFSDDSGPKKKSPLPKADISILKEVFCSE